MTVLMTNNTEELSIAEALNIRDIFKVKMQQLESMLQLDLEYKFNRSHLGTTSDASVDRDQLVVSRPKTNKEKIQKELDYYAKRMRILDQFIQKANYQITTDRTDLFRDFDDGDKFSELFSQDIDRTLADLLVRRKELVGLVQRYTTPDRDRFFDKTETTMLTTESVKEKVPDLDPVAPCNFTKEYDYYLGLLSQCELEIQKLNWTTKVEVTTDVAKMVTPDE